MEELRYSAAVLHAAGERLSIEQVVTAPPAADNVLVRVRAAGLCHTDLEVVDGGLHYPMPIILGHEAAGVVEAVGPDVTGLAPGDHVILSWNPHCGDCFYCRRDNPILCETYLRETVKGTHFDGSRPVRLSDGRPLSQLMFLGAFAEYCHVSAGQAIAIPKDVPLDRACLIGCAVMTGVGAAINVADIRPGDVAMVIGCGAVGLAAVQGACMAGAGMVIAVDLDDAKLALAKRLGADVTVNARHQDAADVARAHSAGRGADVVIEAAGSGAAFRSSVEAVRPGGSVVWLGKTGVNDDVAFRWGSLMQEKRIRRNSYGDARPARDFPMLAQGYLDGRLLLDDLITDRIALADINDGLDRLRRGEAIRSVVLL